MSSLPPRPTTVSPLPEQAAGRAKTRVVWVAIAAGLLLAGGIAFSFLGLRGSQPAAGIPQGSTHPASGVFSAGRSVRPSTSAAPAEVSTAAARDSAEKNTRAAAEAVAQKAEADRQAELMRQQAQAAQLAAQQQALEQQRAEQAEQSRKLAEENARIQAEQQRVEIAKAEAARTIAAADRGPAPTRAHPAYSGPTSGALVWKGEVQGTSLITITGAQADQGELVSGSLPGVLVLLQPADSKHVVIASSPAPSNDYQRLTLRIQGKGMVEQTIHWSIP